MEDSDSDAGDDLSEMLPMANEDLETVNSTFRHFDVSLASQHAYLGHELEETRGSTYFEEGSNVSLPIWLDLGVILFPGQMLPVTALKESAMAMFRSAIEKDNTIGILGINNNADAGPIINVPRIGTTAEIVEFSDVNPRVLHIKARGRQRFKLLQCESLIEDGIFTGKVQILPELLHPVVLPDFRVASLNRFRKNKSFRRKIETMDISAIPWPRFVIDQHDLKQLGARVVNQLYALQIINSKQGVPADEVALSYWVARLLPVNGNYLVQILGMRSAFERLRFALLLLTKGKSLLCSTCGNVVGYRRDILSMSLEGPTGLYCNPGGYVHDIITLSQTKGLTLNTAAPSTEFSWFPGYAWTIATCSGCSTHAGWAFTAVNEQLKLQKFSALCKNAITMNPKETMRITEY